MAFVLWLYLLVPKFLTIVSIGPRFIPSNIYGEAIKPLVLLLRAQPECRAVGISVDGPKASTSVRVPPEDGSTMRLEYPLLLRGRYVVYAACLDGEERILLLVDAGSVEVI